MKIFVWARRKEGMDPEAFRAYWLGPHATLVRRTYTRLRRYVIHPVTAVIPRGDLPFEGIAELVWASKEDFDADVRSPEARAVLADLGTFTSAAGTVVVDEHIVLTRSPEENGPGWTLPGRPV